MLAFQWSRHTLLLATAVPELIAVAAILLPTRLERRKAEPSKQGRIAAAACKCRRNREHDTLTSRKWSIAKRNPDG